MATTTMKSVKEIIDANDFPAFVSLTTKSLLSKKDSAYEIILFNTLSCLNLVTAVRNDRMAAHTAFCLQCIEYLATLPVDHRNIKWPLIAERLVSDFQYVHGKEINDLVSVKALLAHYPTFDINTPSPDTGETILIAAVKSILRSELAVSNLIALGADIHHKTLAGNNAITSLTDVSRDREAKLITLLENGADPQEKLVIQIYYKNGKPKNRVKLSYIDFASEHQLTDDLAICERFIKARASVGATSTHLSTKRVRGL